MKVLNLFRVCLTYILLEKLAVVKCSPIQTLAYMDSLRLFFSNLLTLTPILRCFVVVTDDWYDEIYNKQFFQYPRQQAAYFYLKISNSEDLMAPNYQIVRILKQIKAHNCDFHFVTLLNGLQVKRFLLFVEKNRILNTNHKFVLMHDDRLISTDMLHLWSSMVSTLFVRPKEDASFSISTIAFPSILNNIVHTRRRLSWTMRTHFKISDLFSNKSYDLKGLKLPVAVFQHVPMVVRRGNSYSGLEVEIVRAVAKIMNFQPIFYESQDSEKERWGRKLYNGSYTGLVGQLTSNSTIMAIGDVHVFSSYRDVLDFSNPHSYDCLTFLTPESSQDKSWKTFIQPFNGNMWTGVLLSLFLVGTVFYLLSFIHAILMRNNSSKVKSRKFFSLLRHRRSVIDEAVFDYRDVNFRKYLSQATVPKKNEDLFDNFGNCILLTYSMMMYVSLPRVPRNWPLRVLTGWYWLYCILITVSYRASFTAILANPVPRITIDTLEELLQSRLTLTVGSEENKKLFDNAFDDILKDLGTKTIILASIHGVTEKISKGGYAYYDNQYFLHHLRLLSTETSQADDILHIMRDCVVKMPVALAFPRNSPLKPYIDQYLQQLMESGLLRKWLHDTVNHFPKEEQVPTEAIIDLQKFWSSFVPLVLGYFCGILAIITERWYYRKAVMSHPLYDKYNTSLYYNFKRRFVDY